MALVLATAPLGAQTKESKTAPVEVKRVPPPKPPAKEPVPTPDKYPFRSVNSDARTRSDGGCCRGCERSAERTGIDRKCFCL